MKRYFIATFRPALRTYVGNRNLLSAILLSSRGTQMKSSRLKLASIAAARIGMFLAGNSAFAQGADVSSVDRAHSAPASIAPSGAQALLGGTTIYSADAPTGDALAKPLPSDTLGIPAEQLYSWSGPYVGIRTGASLPSSGSLGLLGSIEAGYDFQPTNSIVTGLEVDLSLIGDDGGLAETSLLGTVTGRLGFLPTQRVLLYGEAGLAAGRVESATALGTDTSLETGYTVGAGAEFAIDEQLTFVGEYNFTDLKDRTTPTGTDQNRSNRFEAGVRFNF
jgi:outer membrane immunogenic protein